jgi:hypothetical protein
MTHNGEDPPHPPVSMLAVCSRTSSRAKCAFISQRLSPPKNPATLKFGMRGGSGLATSLGRMCVYFANTGYQFQPSFGAINGAARKHPLGPGWALPHGQGNLPRGRSIRGRPGPGCLGGGCPEGGFPGQGVAPSGGSCPEGGFLGQGLGSNHGPRGEAQLGPN